MTFQSPPTLVFGDIVADLAVHFRQHPMMLGVDVTSDMKRYSAGDTNLYLHRAGGRRAKFIDVAYIIFEARAPHRDLAYELAQNASGVAWTVPKAVANVVGIGEGTGPLELEDKVNNVMFYRFALNFRSKGFEPV